jgi:3-hydroxyisobutyrate dehydrogenase-like beta-hydroxyacid dehydrogenase
MTIDIPEQLEVELHLLRDRIPEVLAIGLRELRAAQEPATNADAIIAILVNQPTPDQVLALHPSTELQARASDLIARSKAGVLTAQEAAELERYLLLEHLVRMAKAHALQRLSTSA